MQIKMFVTDIDHTLYDAGADRIPAENIQAIRALQQQGVIITLASSRIMAGIQPYIDLFELKEKGGYAFAASGSYAVDCRSGDVIIDRPFSFDDVKTLYELTSRLGLGFTVSQDDTDITGMYTPLIDYDFTKAGVNVLLVHDILSRVSRPCYHICLYKKDGNMADLCKTLASQTSGRYNFIVSQKDVIDVSLQGIDKGFGLSRILDYSGISPDQIAVTGDNDNDIPMFKLARLSGCMANGSDNAKKAASCVTAGCAEGGVADFISRMLLTEKTDD